MLVDRVDHGLRGISTDGIDMRLAVLAENPNEPASTVRWVVSRPRNYAADELDRSAAQIGTRMCAHAAVNFIAVAEGKRAAQIVILRRQFALKAPADNQKRFIGERMCHARF